MSADVRLIGPVAIRTLLADLLGAFARARGLAVEQTYDLNPAVAERIRSGFPFDVGITNPGHVAGLVSAGMVDAATHVAFGRVPLAVAGRRGAGIATGDVSQVLLRARSIAYTAEGTSGRTFLDVAARLGILDAIAGRLLPMQAGRPVAAVAAGEAELAIAPLTTVLAATDTECVSVFPPELGADIAMSMFMATAPRHREHAAETLRFLSDAAHDDALTATGVGRFALGQELIEETR